MSTPRVEEPDGEGRVDEHHRNERHLDTDVALVGAGHAHLHLIRHAARLHAAGLRVTVIAPATFHYSGLLSPVATGLLDERANLIDVAALCARVGVTHLDTSVVAADPDTRVLRCADGRAVRYRAVAYNLGSVSRTDHLDVELTPTTDDQPGARRALEVDAHGTHRVPTSPVAHVLATKPVASLLALRELLAQGPRSPRIDVVGAGPTAVELAACITARRPDARVTMLAPDDAPVPAMPLAVRRRVVRVLRERGVELAMGTLVHRAGPEGLEVGRVAARVADGRADAGPRPPATPIIRRRASIVVLATGLTAPPVVDHLGLGGGPGIAVRATLQHPDHDEVFATGDCSRFLPRELPALGVYGVRAAPVLLEGLLAWADGRPQPVFRPQHRSLQVLELGRGQALAVRGRWWSHGRGALALKRSIDRRWMARYR